MNEMTSIHLPSYSIQVLMSNQGRHQPFSIASDSRVYISRGYGEGFGTILCGVSFQRMFPIKYILGLYYTSILAFNGLDNGYVT